MAAPESPAGEPRIALRGVGKAFGKTRVLEGVDLEIRAGELCVFVGPSGCGKSTLLRIVAGLERPSEGDVYIDGARVTKLDSAKRGVAMVFQSYALYPHMTVRENLAFGLRARGAEAARRIEEAARMLELEGLLERLPRELSGGQRQRVAIGRAITRQPKIFLFDEPLSNLDAALRVTMRSELARLHRRLATTMIYVTHDQVEAMTLADRLVVLNAGRVEQVGPPLEVYRRPRTIFAAGFLGSPRMNLLRGSLAEVAAAGAVIALEGGGSAHAWVRAEGARAGAAVTLGVRPEDVRVAPAGGHGAGAGGAAALAARVVAIEHLGDHAIVHLDRATLDGPLLARVERARFAEGDAVQLELPAAACHVFDAGGLALPRLDARP